VSSDVKRGVTTETQRTQRRRLLCVLCVSVVTLLSNIVLTVPIDQILCTLGPGTTTYNAYSDERPTPDAMELAGKVNGGLGSICRPNCPTMAMFRNKSAADLMLLVTSGQAKIVYKPEFFTSVYDKYGEGGILALIAHEVGHAMEANGTAKWMKPGWNPELRADAWAGCAFAKINVTSKEFQNGMAALQANPSLSHPDWMTRRSAIQIGYEQCGGHR